MALRIQNDCSNIDWSYISETLKTVGMASYSPAVHQQAFENSHTTVFVFDEGKLIGFGRAISDGVCQASIYDVAVLLDYQSKGIGKLVVTSIIERIPQCNFILYAAIGKEGFYRKIGFKQMKTGMALFRNAEYMHQRGFTE